jgi:parvulin-like peptidyl-prolyl isomerase
MLYDDQVRGKVDVAQKEVEDYYTAHKNELVAPEKRDYSILIIGDRNKADEVAALAKKGQDFAQLVKKYSEDPQSAQNGGHTGLNARGRYLDYDETAFSLPEGGISDPVRVPRGFAIIKVWKVEAGKTMPLADAANDIRNALMEGKADKLLAQKVLDWRKDYPIKIFENNLKKAELKKTAPHAAAQADTTKK